MRRILVVKLSALGDLFHAIPVVHLLKAHYGCPVDWVTQPEYVSLLRCNPEVDRILAYPRHGGAGDWRSFVRALRAESYDLALDLQGLAKSGIVLGLARAERKVACPVSREGAAWFANEKPVCRGRDRHALDILLDTLAHVGVPQAPLAYPMDFPPSDPLPGSGPRLAIAPKSRWPAKDWPEERYAEVALRLRKRNGLDVLVLGGEKDAACGDRICQAVGERTFNLCGKSPLVALGGLLRGVDLLLCNDSGPMHFAAAVGTPLVALFGPTDPGKTGPRGPRCTVLRAPPGAKGYPDHRSYKNGDDSLMRSLDVDEVTRAVESMLAKAPPVLLSPKTHP